ncbi:putative Flp pilus-assembly TadE/G-like protein [Geodermatophilus tzadiensis]|uniref:Putative Flp pilus-assembly TadE/G-like protein n=1 Tax=Geodermatophilus tzadiensis TaxID=1137988 RepID=A0A2T0TNZ1_9ACTN|nr:pilus assembly protein TadG-related protein [Geodermatophilus tzadiensis]PRY47444.1 putative Flp pilus-assembly TadE/G-like protein [Geodermatophilus tzadiensis]
MRWLTRRLRPRLGEEHGASAVLLSLLLVPMLGFAAIAVDVGAVYAERARLQVAADAAALAVAQDCARGACGDVQATADTMVAANAGTADADRPLLASGPTRVTVTGRQPTEHWFAPVLGIDATAVSASATVAWGAPGGGTAVLPLTFSWCEFSQQTAGGMPSGTTVRTIRLTKTSGTTDCTGPSRNTVPGGFGYLVNDPGHCRATSAVNGRSTSSTGNTPPADCQPADLTRWLGSTVLLPIFDEYGSTGSNAWYHVYGYAAFRITGYHLGGQFSTSPAPCHGNDRCITGYFTRFVELSDAFSLDPDAPDLGSAVLRLIR